MSAQPARRTLLVALRLLVSGGLLSYLVWRADPANIWASWQRASLGLLGLALLIQLACVTLSAYKWDVLLRARGHRLPFPWLLGVYLIGQFANNFLPTSVGGDALRLVTLGRRIGSYAQASASVFIERISGFLALSLIALTALLITSSDLLGLRLDTDPALRWAALGFALAGVAAAAAALASPWLLGRFERWLPRALRAPLRSVAGALGAYAGDWPTLGRALALSLLFHVSWIGLHIICGVALGVAAPALLYALMVPLTDILGLVPIFFNNVGARDLVFTIYLRQVGVSDATALALAFTAFTVRLLVSALGGVILLLGGSSLRPEAEPTGEPVGEPLRQE